MARRNLCSITDVKKVKGNNVLKDYSVLLTAVEQNSCSVDANFNVLLMGKCLDQLLGMPASKLHIHLTRFQLGEDAIIQALSRKLVGQCALVTLSNQSLQHVKYVQASQKAGVNLPLLMLTGIQVVGDGCETILSYPPFCHHALTPAIMSSKQVPHLPASPLSFSSPTLHGAATPLHCPCDRTTPLPSCSLSPWDSVQCDRSTPLPSCSLSPWDSVQCDRSTPLPSCSLSPWDSVQCDRSTPLPSCSLSPWDSVQCDRSTPLPSCSLSPWDSVQCDRSTPLPSCSLSPWDSVQHGRSTPLPSCSLSPWDSVQHGRTTPLPSCSLSPWDSVQCDRSTPLPSCSLSPWDSVQCDRSTPLPLSPLDSVQCDRPIPVPTYSLSSFDNVKLATIETPELFADPDRDATDSSLSGSPELFLAAATPVISRQRCPPKKMLVHLEAKANSLTPDIL